MKERARVHDHGPESEMTKQGGKIYRWIFVTLLLLSITSSVYAYQPATQPSPWRTTPTMSSDVQPNYQFRSTSTYRPVVGQTSYTSRSTTYYPGASRPRRSSPWDDEGDPSGLGVGEVDDPAPIGDIPYILMALMAGIYVIWKKNRKKIHELFAYFKKKQ